MANVNQDIIRIHATAANIASGAQATIEKQWTFATDTKRIFVHEVGGAFSQFPNSTEVILKSGAVAFTGDQSMGGYGLTAARDLKFLDVDTLEIDHATGLWSLTSSVAQKFIAKDFTFEDSDEVGFDLSIYKTAAGTWNIATEAGADLWIGGDRIVLFDHGFASNPLIFNKPDASNWNIETASTVKLNLIGDDIVFKDTDNATLLTWSNDAGDWQMATDVNSIKWTAAGLIQFYYTSTKVLELDAYGGRFGEAATYIDVGANLITNLTAGTITFTTGAGGVIVNSGKDNDTDFTVHGTSVDNLILTDASADLLSFGGDTVFIGAGSGFPYGGFLGDEIAWTQSSAAQNTWYAVTSASIASTTLNLTTQASGVLTLAKAGTYAVTHSESCSASALNRHVNIGLSVDDATPLSRGRVHFDNLGAGDEVNLSAQTLIDVTAGQTIRVKIQTTDTGSPALTISHINLTAIQVGG